MKYRLWACLLFLPMVLWASGRPKVAVVLSGGGAKGTAHIGALKVIEEAGIPIDYVVGTSMGAIVGGLYSIGYTPQQLDSMVNAQNWKFLLSDAPNPKDVLLDDRLKSERYVLSIPFSLKSAAVSDAGIIKGKNLARLFSTLTEGMQSKSDIDGTVGNNFLKRFNMIIDFKTKELYLQPNNYFWTPFYDFLVE